MRFIISHGFTGMTFALLFALGASMAAAQSNPVPLINQPLVPDAVAPGGAAFTLTVDGTGFVSGAVVKRNGSGRATTFVSGSQITAAISAADIAAAGTASVTVVNPAPGGGTSTAVFLTITNSVSTLGFNKMAPPIIVGLYPDFVAVADFNGDGKQDLAVANSGSNTVSILLGDGTGNFTLVSSPATGVGPNSVAVGDFNGDGKLDLATSNGWSNTATILLGNGDGTFSMGSSPATGIDPLSIAAGDFNGDGKLDLAVVNRRSYTVSILLGNGDGTFRLKSSPEATAPWGVAVGDFNGDGRLDLAVTNTTGDSVTILLGNGDGTFTPAPSPATGNDPVSVAVGDFNGDGKPDLAVANDGDSTVSILLGNGDGTFTLGSLLVSFNSPSSIVVGDFNGDGKLDVATSNYGQNIATVLLGDGTGHHFTLAASPLAVATPISLAAGDFDGDGRLDLAVVGGYGSDFNTGGLAVLLQSSAILSASNINFNTQLLNTTSEPKIVTLTNVGGSAVTITGITVTGDYAQANTCGNSIAQGASCSISVTFTPTSLGKLLGTVNIADNGGGSPQILTLAGLATAVGVMPGSLRFSHQVARTISPPQTVTITNTGSVTLTNVGITLGGDDSGRFLENNNCGTALAAGASCTATVIFVPPYLSINRAYLEVSDTGGGAPQKCYLYGKGT